MKKVKGSSLKLNIKFRVFVRDTAFNLLHLIIKTVLSLCANFTVRANVLNLFANRREKNNIFLQSSNSTSVYLRRDFLR